MTIKKKNEPRPYLSTIAEAVRLQSEVTGYMRTSINSGTDTEGRMFAYTALKSNEFLIITRASVEDMVRCLYDLSYFMQSANKNGKKDNIQLIKKASECIEAVRKGYNSK